MLELVDLLGPEPPAGELPAVEQPRLQDGPKENKTCTNSPKKNIFSIKTKYLSKSTSVLYSPRPPRASQNSSGSSPSWTASASVSGATRGATPEAISFSPSEAPWRFF